MMPFQGWLDRTCCVTAVVTSFVLHLKCLVTLQVWLTNAVDPSKDSVTTWNTELFMQSGS